jgi:flap endonuclease-1
MGIRNLKQIFNNFSERCITKKNISDYKYKKIAIDTSIFIYKFLYHSDDILRGLIPMLNLLLKNKITPFFVFDGKPPEEKSEVLKERKEQKQKLKEKIDELKKQIEEAETPEDKKLIEIEKTKCEKQLIYVNDGHIELFKRCLDGFGIPYCVANGEAEVMCAELYKLKLVSAVLSNDSDCLPNGCNILLRNYNPMNGFLEEYVLDYALEDLNITMDQFIDICILMGCDYCEKIKYMGPVYAVAYIKKHKNLENIIEFIENNKTKFIIPEDFNYKKARDLFQNHNLVDDFKINNKIDNIQKYIELSKPQISKIINLIKEYKSEIPEYQINSIACDIFDYFEDIISKY